MSLIWQEFEAGRHNRVLRVEARTTLVLDCQTFMQVGLAWVSLGAPSTNVYLYTVKAH